jgi:hypothetical protein
MASLFCAFISACVRAHDRRNGASDSGSHSSRLQFTPTANPPSPWNRVTCSRDNYQHSLNVGRLCYFLNFQITIRKNFFVVEIPHVTNRIEELELNLIGTERIFG